MKSLARIYEKMIVFVENDFTGMKEQNGFQMGRSCLDDVFATDS